MLKTLALLAFLSCIPALAQDTPDRIALTGKSNIPAKQISDAFQKQKECRNVSIADDVTNSDFALDVLHKGSFVAGQSFEVTLFDHDGITFRSVSQNTLAGAVKQLCQALRTEVTVEVVDPENLTQSVDARGTGAGLEGLTNTLTGRRTHTDASTMSVIVNGEHALLDCYERAKGCVPVGPGKYYGEFDADKRSIWVEHDIPLTHAHVRDHYVIAGSW